MATGEGPSEPLLTSRAYFGVLVKEYGLEGKPVPQQKLELPALSGLPLVTPAANVPAHLLSDPNRQEAVRSAFFNNVLPPREQAAENVALGRKLRANVALAIASPNSQVSSLYSSPVGQFPYYVTTRSRSRTCLVRE